MAMNLPFPVVDVLKLFRDHETREAWLDYDQEADALYVNFQRPLHADHAEIDENDVVLRYQGERLIGFTILNASKRENS